MSYCKLFGNATYLAWQRHRCGYILIKFNVEQRPLFSESETLMTLSAWWTHSHHALFSGHSFSMPFPLHVCIVCLLVVITLAMLSTVSLQGSHKPGKPLLCVTSPSQWPWCDEITLITSVHECAHVDKCYRACILSLSLSGRYAQNDACV